MTDRSSTAERRELLAKVALPIRAQDGPDYAELLSADDEKVALTIRPALIVAAVNDYARHLDLEDRVAALEEALGPSADTKGAYSGEVEYSYVELDEFGDERTVKRLLEWTTIKEVMALIRARARVLTGDHPHVQ